MGVWDFRGLILINWMLILFQHVEGLLAILTYYLGAFFLQIVGPTLTIGPTICAEVQHQPSMSSHRMALVDSESMKEIVFKFFPHVMLAFGVEGHARAHPFSTKAFHVQHSLEIGLAATHVDM